MSEHRENRGNKKTFTGSYFCYNLIYYEEFNDVMHAIDREKQLKKWRREKKENLIKTINPDWNTINVPNE
ncbi:MAG: nuclease family protein [Bacteroidota bacterium]|nr:nuclease family protein [Bacteroidota bacterium]